MRSVFGIFTNVGSVLVNCRFAIYQHSGMITYPLRGNNKTKTSYVWKINISYHKISGFQLLSERGQAGRGCWPGMSASCGVVWGHPDWISWGCLKVIWTVHLNLYLIIYLPTRYQVPNRFLSAARRATAARQGCPNPARSRRDVPTDFKGAIYG